MQVFRSLSSRNFRFFVSGQSVSMLGTWMQKVAVSWIVYQLTHSAFYLGLTMFANLIPSLFLSPYAGSYTDRHNRYNILLITQILLMVQAGLFTLVIFLKIDSIAIILALSLMQGLINAFDTTARQSLLINMIDNKEDLPNAIAINSSMANLTRILGPALGGILLSTLGETSCFLINFVSYFFVIYSLLKMKLNLPASKKQEVRIWQTLKEGLIYLKQSPDLSSLIVLMAGYSLFVIPFSTLLPVFAKDVFHGDAGTFSWFESAAGVGALLGTVYFAGIKPGRNIIQIVVFASLIFSIGVLLLSVSFDLVLALFFTLVTGMGMMTQTAAINTYLQTHVSDEMRGRVISYFIMGYQGIIPVGSLLIGILSSSCGAKVAVAVAGAAGVISTLVFVYFKYKNGPRKKITFFPSH
ncbi:Predicted arabinose efflux permease, MFS family [Arachidicoccus rhizosphaerae]|uniref:Predicted arabinose efflux permease, MFS family n=1 Tax=Arachidicoccus rhizosphaerae TaxID=551991 RepID=A0A1H3WQH7_9BACT|nr:MFS transporter [Arachidicoccus rhizosphaerae]SDZ88604.1 Predicted arabinose efflux permease, MFS family [Arachidicoccus rhizosphaerae]